MFTKTVAGNLLMLMDQVGLVFSPAGCTASSEPQTRSPLQALQRSSAATMDSVSCVSPSLRSFQTQLTCGSHEKRVSGCRSEPRQTICQGIGKWQCWGSFWADCKYMAYVCNIFTGRVELLTQLEQSSPWRAAVVIGLLSAGSQLGYDTMYKKYSRAPDTTPFLERLSRHPYMPLKRLPDDEYESILTGRITKLETEISIVEGQIDSLKNQKVQFSPSTP